MTGGAAEGIVIEAGGDIRYTRHHTVLLVAAQPYMPQQLGPLPQILPAPLLSDAQIVAKEYLHTHFHVSNPATSPNVLWCNTPEVPLGIQTLRDVSQRWAVSPGNDTLFVVVLSAELLSTETQNALLKTLEEPPRLVQFVLVTSTPHSLLPTILSRCHLVPRNQTYHLSREQVTQVTTVLEQLKPNLLSSAIAVGDTFSDRATAQYWVRLALVWTQLQKTASKGTKERPTNYQVDWVQWQLALLTAAAQLAQNGHVKLIMSELFLSYLSATDK